MRTIEDILHEIKRLPVSGENLTRLIGAVETYSQDFRIHGIDDVQGPLLEAWKNCEYLTAPSYAERQENAREHELEMRGGK